MDRLTRTVAAALLLALVAALGSCGGGKDEPAKPDYPDDAVYLQQNVPQKYGDYRLVAVNVAKDKGFVLVEMPGGGNERLAAAKGRTISTEDGRLSLEVVGIEPPDGSQDSPGKGTGRIVVVPKA